MSAFRVRAAAGTLKGAVRADLDVAHRWTDGGVAVEARFTGAHLLHLAVGGCVLNDVLREAERSGVAVDGVIVTVDGAFDPDTWASTGISCSVEVDSPAPEDAVAALLRTVEEVAEIPRAVRAGAPVIRQPAP